MNVTTSSIAHAQTESGVIKFVLISLGIVLMTAAIAKQLPASSTDAVAMVSLADLDL